MKYDVTYFIEKLSAIPDALWKMHGSGYAGEPRCANGHCMGVGCSDLTEETADLCVVFDTLKYHNKYTGKEINNRASYPGRYSFAADQINNGMVIEYQQPTPKARILAALHDIKKLQQPAHGDITKELAKFPVDETSDSLTPKTVLQ